MIGVATSDDLFNGMPLPVTSPRRPRLFLTTDGAVVKCPRLSTATSKESLWLNSQPAHLSSGLPEPVSLRNSMPGKWLDPGDMSHVDSSAREHRCASGQNKLIHNLYIYIYPQNPCLAVAKIVIRPDRILLRRAGETRFFYF